MLFGQYCFPRASGVLQRALFITAALVASALPAAASSITFNNVPLSGDLRGATVGSASASVTWGNLGNPTGDPFGMINFSLINLQTNGDWITGAPNGYSAVLNLFVGAGADFVSVFDFGVVWNSAGAILGTNSSIAYTAIDAFGNFGGTNPTNGDSVIGILNAAGNVVSSTSIARLPGEDSGLTTSVSGTLSGGYYGAGVNGNAWMAVNGNRITLQDRGLQSAIRTVNEASGLGGGFNTVGGIRYAAIWRASDGGIMYLPAASGTGNMQGEVVSIANGLVTIKTPTGMFISDGIQTVPLSQWVLNAGGPAGLTSQVAWFNALSPTHTRLTFQGSQWDFQGTTSDMRLAIYQPVGDGGGTGEIPEPATIALTGSGVAALVCWRRRKRRTQPSN